jgi:hypothetical protein
MEEKYCRNCLYARPLLTTTNADLVECKYEGPRYDDLCGCDRWASRHIDEAHEEKIFDVAQLKPSNKHYILCYIDNKTGEGHLVVKLDLKFRTKTMLPDAIYNMTLQELLDMEALE